MQTPNAMRNLSGSDYGQKPIRCHLGSVEISATMDRNAGNPHLLHITISTRSLNP